MPDDEIVLQQHKLRNANKHDRFAHFPEHSNLFINDPAHARPGIHPFPDRLWVIAVLDNPLRWRSRYLNYNEFRHHVEQAGALLITVELAFGDRPFEITSSDNPFDLQVRTRDEMFHKENLGMLGAALLPLGTRYVAFIDCDMTFTRSDWAQETLHQLQHFDIVQMFSTYTDLDYDQKPYRTMSSFMYNYWNTPDLQMKRNVPESTLENPLWWTAQEYYAPGPGKPKPWPWGFPGATGGAWAYRTEALSALGGLMDRCVIGSADWYMAFALIQAEDPGPETRHCTDQYKRYILEWTRNAARLKKNVGYVDAHLIHHWHGDKLKRQYGDRWKILQSNHYDPYVDIMRDYQGVYIWQGDKPRLRDEVRRYFRARREDGTERS